MKRIMALAHAGACYILFLGVFLYGIGFVGSLDHRIGSISFKRHWLHDRTVIRCYNLKSWFVALLAAFLIPPPSSLASLMLTTSHPN